MGVWEDYSIERNFDELISEVNKMKSYTLSKFKTLEKSTNIAKIQKFATLHIDSIQVSRREDSNWYSKTVNIRLDFSYEANKYIQEKNIQTAGIAYDKSWKHMSVRIDTEDETALNCLIAFVEKLAETEYDDHLRNIEKQKINQQTVDQIFKLLKEVGVSDTYYGYKTNRSKDTTKMYYNFPTEIRKQIPTIYSENRLDEKKKDIIRGIKEIWNKEVGRIREEKRKKEKELQEKENNKKIALLLAKYDLELTNDWRDLINKIIEKNKYLYLAHYLEKNRDDWSEGYHYATYGLSRFNIESDLDQKIAVNIQSYIDDWDGDGRVFRDCEYNFSVLYGMAGEQDEHLCKDYFIVKEKVEDF